MPSFLSDENSPFFINTGIVHIDPAAEYGLPGDKVHGQLIPRQPHPQPSRDSFEESSTPSTEASAHARQLVNGDSSWPPSMSTLQNGSPVAGAPDNERVGTGYEKAMIKEDAAARRPPLTNGTKESYDAPTRRPPSPPRESANAALGSGPATPSKQVVDILVQPTTNGVVWPSNTVPNSLVSSQVASHGSATSSTHLATVSAPSLSPATPSPEVGQHAAHSPHCFSSPPICHAPGAGASSSGLSQVSAGPSSGLKYRHTLEVPKVAPGRGSRDGNDTSVFASGRFSPTAASSGVRRASLSIARRNTRSLHSDQPRDEIMPDEDAIRWAEAYRAKRASKKRRREFEDDERVLVGTKVDETHANWVTAYNMLTGIRVSVSRTNAKIDRPLTDADFEAKQKSTFDIAGNELVPSAKYDFKFKDYAPWVFRHLRARFRLDPADYLMSLTGKYILSELGSPGKSGSFFYFSRDYKYIIKTIHHGEHKFLRKILKDYHQHVNDNPNTLLSQFYGLHRVKMPYGKKIHFVIMNNLFPPHRDIHQTFDLKGSTIGRDFREEDLEKNPRATLKDLNWLRRQRHLELGIQKKRLFLEQLHSDVRLLQKLQIMDYSLLVGIHDLQRGNEENLRDKTLKVFNPGGDASQDMGPSSLLMRTPSKLENQRKTRELRQMVKLERPGPVGEMLPNELEEGKTKEVLFYRDDGGLRATHEDEMPGDEIYYLGIIDCLTHYGIVKKMENFWKGLSNDRTQISALPPKEYGDRFLSFVKDVTMSQEEAGRLANERDAALQVEAATEERGERIASWGSTNSRRQRRSSNAARIPPIPEHAAPLAPGASNLVLAAADGGPHVHKLLSKAEYEARQKRGASERDIPDRTLRALHSPEPGNPILPIVEEAAEVLLGDSISHTFARHGGEQHGHDNGIGPVERAPPIPPKMGHNGYGPLYSLRQESADSGYGVGTVKRANSNASHQTGNANGLHSVTGSQKSIQVRVRSQISRDSLDKALPPLPPGNQQVAATTAHPAQRVA